MKDSLNSRKGWIYMYSRDRIVSPPDVTPPLLPPAKHLFLDYAIQNALLLFPLVLDDLLAPAVSC
jgi:hypothetical protein